MIRLRAFLQTLRRADRGAATVEFAFMSLFFFAIVITALDFGVYAQQKLKFGDAMEQGAVVAFNTRDTIDPNAVATYVKTAAGLTTTPSVTCNNGATCVAASARGSSDYRCINRTTGAIEITQYSAGATCASGGNAGYYLTITATKVYSPIAVPDKWLGGTTMTQTTVVRLS